MNPTKSILAVAAISALLTAASPAASHAASGNTIVGSWKVKILPEDGGIIANLATMTADGSIINTDPTFATGHGVWEERDNEEFFIKFVHLVSTDEGVPPGTTRLTIRGLVEATPVGIGPSEELSEELSGPFVTTFDNWAGEELGAFGGTVELVRIVAD